MINRVLNLTSDPQRQQGLAEASQGVPGDFMGSQGFPETRWAFQQILRGSEGFPGFPRISQGLPGALEALRGGAPRDSQGLPEAPKGSQGFPGIPRGSQGLNCRALLMRLNWQAGTQGDLPLW